MNKEQRTYVTGLKPATIDFFNKSLLLIPEGNTTFGIGMATEAAKNALKGVTRNGFASRDNAAKATGFILLALNDEAGYRKNHELEFGISEATSDLGEQRAQEAAADLLDCCAASGITPLKQPISKGRKR